MKSKSKGFFHFGSRHSKDDSATVPQHHARKEKRNVGSSAGSKSVAEGGRKNGNAGIAFIDDSQRQMNIHREKCWRWEQSKRDNVYEMIHELREADQNFWNHEFDEAIALYLSAIPIAREKLFHEDANVTVGEINVKISIILQGRGELQSAIDHLQKAKDIFTTAYNDVKSDDDDDDDFFRIVMAEKIVEVTHGIANTFVEMGEKDEASKYHEDAIELCKKFFPKDVLRLSDALNNYANFLSICQNDHDGALERFKEALKILFQANHGLLNAQSAPTLTNMGKLYMRRTEPFQGVEVQKDAKKAEVCFARAVQLYRMSMMYNRNEKIAETLYNFMQAREWQAGKGKGILKNVRFDPQPIERQYTAADFLMSTEDDSRIEDEDDYDEDDYTYDSSTVATDQFMLDFDIFGCFATTNNKNIATSRSRNVEDKIGDIHHDAKQNKPVLLNDSKSNKVLQEQNSETLKDAEQGGDSKEKQLPSLNVGINCQGTHHHQQQQQQEEKKKKKEEGEGEEIMQQQQPKLQPPSKDDDGDRASENEKVDADGTNPLVSVDYFLNL